MKRYLLPLSLIVSTTLYSQTSVRGTVSGSVASESNRKPLEMVNIIIRNVFDSTIVTGTVSDRKGQFEIQNVPAGEFFITYSILGHEEKNSTLFSIDASHQEIELPKAELRETALDLGDVTVTGKKTSLNVSIDRKVYNVQQDIMSKTGTASDLLQNVPSVQVDIDGNVTLRGSANVLMLINGNPSPLLGKNRAEALQQMPADLIERIEVISNPTAKFKPDGTAGIINIVMKKESYSGVSGSLGGNGGNNRRYNGSSKINFASGPLSVVGAYSPRQDERNTSSSDSRHTVDTATNVLGNYKDVSTGFMRPFSQVGSLATDYRLDEQNTFGISGNYLYRDFTRNEKSSRILTDNAGLLTGDYDRLRTNYQHQTESDVTAYLQHSWPEEDHKLRLAFNWGYQPEIEDNRYTVVTRTPAIPTSYDNTLIHQTETLRQLTLEYSSPGEGHSMLETGYVGDFNTHDMDYYGSFYDSTARSFVTDVQKTNHFMYDENIHAFYGTYGISFGSFGVLAGLRGEQSFVRSNLVSRDSVIDNSYFRFYPTLHLSYKLDKVTELQVNYSRRVNRPESEDLNPFPEYQDPRNLRAGNPRLLPEFIHSVELGFQLQYDNITVVPGVFYRNRQNAFTTVLRPLNDSTLLRTHENLSTDQSGGVELILSVSYADFINANLSTNVFYNEIDASNLGFGTSKSTLTWTGSLNCNVNIAPGTMAQLNSNYRSAQLTPQGEQRPTFVVNVGFRQELFDETVTLTATLSDAARTLERKTNIDTQWLQQDLVSVRDHQILYFGLTYHFGKPAKKTREKSLQYDNGG